MKLIRVEMRGFRSHQEVEMGFSQHRLIRIRGGNGVGKSAILESLGWAIFGRLRGRSSIRDATHRLSTRDERGRSQRSDGPRVKWIVEINGKEYRVDRWRRNARVKVVDGSRYKTVAGSQAVSSFMAGQLGIAYNDLRSTAWCLQDDVMRPVSMVKKDRRRLIRRLLLDDHESNPASGNREAKPADAVREARRQVETVRRQLDEVIKNLKKVEERESHTRKQLDSLREREKAMLERRSRHQLLVAEMGGAEKERASLRLHLEDCADNLQTIQGIEARVLRFDPDALDQAAAQLEDELFELDCLETDLQSTRDERLAERARADARGDWYTDVAKTLGVAIAKGGCPTCERQLWTGHATLIDRRDHANAEARRVRLQRDRASQPATREIELSDDIRHVTGEIDVLQNRVKELQYEHGYYAAAQAMLNRLQSQATKHAQLEAAVAATVQRLEKCRRERDALDYCEEEYERLNADLSEAEVEWREAMEEAEELRTRRDGFDREYRQRVQHAMYVSAEAVGIDVQEDDVRSHLEEQMNEIVTELIRGEDSQPPLSVSIDEGFRPTVHEQDRNGPRVSSGGLDVVVALAMRLALMRLVNDRHGPRRSPMGGVFILDEPFGNVDRRWREKFLNLLTRDEWRVNQVVEISSWDRHDDDSRKRSGSAEGWEKTVYTVSLANGRSVVTETVTRG